MNIKKFNEHYSKSDFNYTSIDDTLSESYFTEIHNSGRKVYFFDKEELELKEIKTYYSFRKLNKRNIHKDYRYFFFLNDSVVETMSKLFRNYIEYMDAERERINLNFKKDILYTVQERGHIDK